MEEHELETIMREFGEVTRVKIPKDEQGRSRGIGFATFRNKEDCTKVADAGAIRYDFYELPVERATMSNKRREQQREGGGFRGGFGDRDGERSFRGGDREGGRGGRGGFRGGFRGGDREGGGFRGGDREGGGYRREPREPDSGFLRRNLDRR